MAIRVYLVPAVAVTENGKTRRGPKYFAWPWPESMTGGVRCDRASTDYGLLDYILEVANVTTAQHNTIAANSDVVALPANLNAVIGVSNLATVRDALEARNIPADWITASMTYRTVLRALAALFFLAQRYHGLHLRRIIETGYTLDSTIGDLPDEARQRLNGMAQSFGFDTSTITLATTIRQALRILFQQWTEPIHLGLGVDL